jgi:hypothetical protein
MDAFGKAVRSSRSRYLGAIRPVQEHICVVRNELLPECDSLYAMSAIAENMRGCIRTLSVSQSSLMLSTSVRITMAYQPGLTSCARTAVVERGHRVLTPYIMVYRASVSSQPHAVCYAHKRGRHHQSGSTSCRNAACPCP